MALADTAQLAVRLTLDDRAFSGPLNRVQSKVGLLQRGMGKLGGAASHFGGRIRQLGGALLNVAGVGGVVGLAYSLEKAVTSASDFAAAMELVHTQAGASQEEVHNLTGSVLALAPAVGTAPEVLAAGLFHIESAGLRGSTALDVLRTAAEGARVGQSNLEDTTNALIATVTTGIGGVNGMSQAMGVLNAIVGAGNLRMEDLAQSMASGVLSSAATFGISLQSVGGALAELTRQGIPAEVAATRLRMTISLLGAPTAKAAKLLKTIGIGPQQLAKDLRSPGGILTALTDLKKHLDDSGLSATAQAQLLSRAFGGGRSSSAILALLNRLDDFKTVQDQINKGTNTFDEAWATTTQNAAFKFERFQAVVSSTLIRIGDALLPTVTDAIDKLGTFISENQDKIVTFVHQALDLGKGIAGTIGNVVGSIARLWGAIPGPLQDLLIKGFAADRTINFLFGFSLTGALKGVLVSGLGGALARAGIGKLFVQPVFVTNPGFGGGGLPGAAGGGIGLVGTVLSGAALTALLAGVQKFVVEPGLQQQAGQNIGEVQSVIATGDRTKIQAALDGINAGINNLDPLQSILYQLNADGVKVHTESLVTALQNALATTPINRPGSPDDRNDASRAAALRATVAQTRDATEASRIALSTRLGAVRGAVMNTTAALNRLQMHTSVNLPIYIRGGLVYTGVPTSTGGTLNKVTVSASSGPSGVSGAGHGM